MATDKSAQRDPQTPVNPFGETENKSLQSEQTEGKAATAETAEPAAEDTDGVEVLLLHHVTHDGKDLLPGKPYTLPERVARSLVSARRAKHLED